MADNNVENLFMEYQQYRFGELELGTLQRNEDNENSTAIDNLIENEALNFSHEFHFIKHQQGIPFDNCSTRCLTGNPTFDTNGKTEDTGTCSTSSCVSEPIYKSKINSNQCDDMEEALTSSLTEQNKMEILSYIHGLNKEYVSASGVSNKDTRSNGNANVTESFEGSRNSFQINNPETTGNIGNKGSLHRKRDANVQGIIKYSAAPKSQIFPKKGSVIDCDTSNSEYCNNLKLLVPSKDTVAAAGPSSVSFRAQRHFEEGLFIGTECKKGFVCQKEVVYNKTHKSKKPFACNTCGKRFLYESLLTTHLRVHNGEKPFSCDQCKYRTSSKGRLTKHQRIHTDERPYSCDKCGYKLKKKDLLNLHLLIHTREKLNSSNKCETKINRKGI